MLEHIKELFIANALIITISGVAYLLDFITGFSKAALNNNIQSSKLRKSARKGIIYFTFIIMCMCLQLLFPLSIPLFNNKSIDFFVYIGNLYIIMTEFLSVRENGKEFLKAPAIDNFLKSKQKQIDEVKIPDNEEK